MTSKYKTKTKIREVIIAAYINHEIDFDSVVSRLGVSKRQCYRLLTKYKETNTLEHGLCSKPSNHSINIAIKNQVLNLYRNKYRGFNYEHACELLEEMESIKISHDTLRLWLLDNKLTLPKRRKPKKYMRRTPKESFNDMIQLDGTFGDFLGDGNMYCLMHMVDDATKTSLAYLYDSECTQSALDILYKWCVKYGVPKSIYSDKHSTYKVVERQKLTIEEELEGKEFRQTEFGIVCERLGIMQIFANSPQAKGRVERKHHMYKDRLVKELRLYGITTQDEANGYLTNSNGFINKLNDKFTIEAKRASNSVMIAPEELTQYFTIDAIRTVRNDYTISYNGQAIQLLNNVAKPRNKVTVKILLNGTMKIVIGKQDIKYKALDNYSGVSVVKQKSAIPKAVKKVAKISPWRNFNPKKHQGSTNCNTKYYDYLARHAR